MKLKRFDVVELNNGNKATIFDTKNNEYYGEIVNDKGITIEHRNINEDEIKKVLIFLSAALRRRIGHFPASHDA